MKDKAKVAQKKRVDDDDSDDDVRMPHAQHILSSQHGIQKDAAKKK